ncbi:MAG TPA: YbdK family carboxylate-amine ligase [Gaiellaceae bacterium]|nr:YbdK family carboxylate-amine ligase [Gaiellaceae bacterium]
MIEQHFGESPPLSIGVEEEVMLLDAETLAPVGAIRQLLEATDGLKLPGTLKTELHASVVELTTGICETPAEAVEALRELRGRTAEAIDGLGLRIAAAGSHPFAEPEDLPITDDKRYEEMVGYHGITARRQGVNGLHVHIGMPGAEACMRTLETILPWLPLVLALSANSPYLAGRVTGLASNRAEILAQLPRSAAPPAFDSYATWAAWIQALVATGLMKEYTQVWWDVRPHPRFGTIEIRMPDQPTDLGRTAAFVELLRNLCEWALEDPAGAPADRGVYQQNRWAAARFGPDAELVFGGRLVRARDLHAELPFASPLDASVSEAELQLDQPDPAAAASDIVARTWPS